jgi:hypothetical protein
MALSSDQPRKFLGTSHFGDFEMELAASDIVYEGAALSDAGGNGYAKPLTAGEAFLGFAMKHVDNSAGAAGAVSCPVRLEGIVSLPISGLAVTDRGAIVYASDDGTFTKTVGANTPIGKIVGLDGTANAWVHFESAVVRDAA